MTDRDLIDEGLLDAEPDQDALQNLESWDREDFMCEYPWDAVDPVLWWEP